MPHYKNGQPATIGDMIHHKPPNAGASEALGILVSITAGGSCNGQLLPVARKWDGSTWLPVLPVYQDCISLKDCLPVGQDPADKSLPRELTEAAAPQGDGDPRPVSAT